MDLLKCQGLNIAQIFDKIVYSLWCFELFVSRGLKNFFIWILFLAVISLVQ